MKGKYIEISTNDNIVDGLFVNYRHKEYFYELILKKGRYKKRIVLYYPFSMTTENGVICFDYRLRKLSHRCPVELLYNVLEQCSNAHSFLNNIVKLYEVRPNTKLS